MRVLTNSFWALGLAAIGLSGCSIANKSDATSPAVAPGSFSAAAGITVYEQNCASCHGVHSTSNIRDKTLQQIEAALGRPAMESLQGRLSETDLGNLTFALRTDIDALPPATPGALQVTVLGPTGVALQWSAVTDNAGGSGVQEYRIFRDGALIATVEGTTLSHSDQLLSPSTTYSFQIQAVDQIGNLSEKSPPVPATTAAASVGPDTTAPPTPAGLVGTAKSPTRLEVRWRNVADESGGSGLKGYRLFRNDVYVTDLSPSTLQYLDTNLGANSPYKYQVTAVDNSDNESAKGAGVTVSTMAVDAPSLYAARCQSCHGALGESDVRNQSAAQIATAIASVGSMSGLSDLGPAEIAALESYLILQVDTTAPTVPTALAGTATSFAQVQLSWNASSDTGGSGLSGYRIYRGTTQIATVGAGVLTYANSGLTAQTTYSYQIEAIDGAGNTSAKSTAITVTTPAQPATPDTTAPTIPSNLLGTVVSATRLRIRWTASTDAGGSGVAAYRVRRNGNQVGQVPVGTLEYLDTNLPAGTSFTYTVVAVDNSFNASAPSAGLAQSTPAVNGATLYANRCASCHNPLATSTKRNRTSAQIAGAITAEPMMSSLMDLGVDEVAAIAVYLTTVADTVAPSIPSGLAGLAASTARINLSWNVTTDTGGSGLKRYEVYLGATLLATVDAPATSYGHLNLTAATPYSYKIRAVDNAGNLSAFAASVTVTTLTSPPGPDTVRPTVPGSLAATPAANSVALSWTAATDNTGGSGVVGYKLYRNTVYLKNVNAPAVTASDTGLNSSTQYSYQVTAVDAAGNESAKSTARAVSTLAPDAPAIYAARCAGCHGNFASSNLKLRYETPALFTVAFNNALRPVAQGGIAEMQGKTLTAAELAALAPLMAGLDPDPDGGEDGAFQTAAPAGTRLYIASFLADVFVNGETPAAGDETIKAIIAAAAVRNPTLGGGCNRYDATFCPATGATHSVYQQAVSRPSQNISRAGYITNLCAQILSVGEGVTNPLTRLGLSVDSAVSDTTLRKVYGLFFPFRTAEAGVLSNLSALHAQSRTRGMAPLDAWRMVLVPLCESAVGGGL